LSSSRSIFKVCSKEYSSITRPPNATRSTPVAYVLRLSSKAVNLGPD
jgi:hypothetical protein